MMWLSGDSHWDAIEVSNLGQEGTMVLRGPIRPVLSWNGSLLFLCLVKAGIN